MELGMVFACGSLKLGRDCATLRIKREFQKGNEMPLAFESLSHGTIAFGFFNIESDLLLLEHYFFFADDFCGMIEEMSRAGKGEPAEYELPGYDLDYRVIGDLHGAIAGTRLTGFIGEIYKLFPFPSQMEAFKQDPEGFKTRRVVEEVVEKFGRKVEIPVRVMVKERRVGIGEYLFSFEGFHALLNYVWRGGYPRWKGERRPDYVLEMASAVGKSESPVFKGMTFEA